MVNATTLSKENAETLSEYRAFNKRMKSTLLRAHPLARKKTPIALDSDQSTPLVLVEDLVVDQVTVVPVETAIDEVAIGFPVGHLRSVPVYHTPQKPRGDWDKLNPASVTQFFALLRTMGIAEISQQRGKEEHVFRCELNSYVMAQMRAKEGLALVWSDERPTIDAEYQIPSAVSKLSELLHLYTLETGLFIELNHKTWERGSVAADDKRGIEASHPNKTHLGDLTDAYLAQAELTLQAEMETEYDVHQQVHIQEVYTTFCMTVLQLLDAMYDFPSKLETDTRPPEIVFEMHSALSGLIESPYLFEDPTDPKEPAEDGSVGSQRLHRRLTLDTDRRGKDVSFEELANVYRTSRVTMSNVVKRVKQQLRAKIVIPELDYEGVFKQAA